MKIKEVQAYEILASNGYPTLECIVVLEDGSLGKASVPYGVSAGSYEATVLRDNDPRRYAGGGMLKAKNNIQTIISPALVGQDAFNQRQIDQIMLDLDGTATKSRLGGNAILVVSIAVAKAAATSQKKDLYQYIIDTYQTGVDLTSLPQPMTVVIEGGKHADNTTDLQEYCLSATRTSSIENNLQMIMETYHELAKVLKNNALSTNVGNEGAFAPSGITSNEAPFAYILEAIEKAGYLPKSDIGISIDAAANEFFINGRYNLKLENRFLSPDELISYYTTWMAKYPIITMEDMLSEDDWENWKKLKIVCDKYHIPLIGDDLTVTNITRLNKAIERKAISAILIKLNQIGTLTETIDCCQLARQNGLITITSHRGGGETNDTTMVDVAVAVGSAFIKVGPTRGERVSKYNRLIAIAKKLGR
mgnify:CR=1 FL=1